MSEDLTQALPTSDSDKLNLILTIVQNLEGRLQRLETRVDDIDLRLQSLEQKVDERLHDTRPIWEKVIANIAQLKEGQERLHEEVHEIRTSQRDAGRRMSVFHDTLLSIQADYRDIYDRVRGLETNRNP
jgi:chromosome segregation ATPase